MSFFTYNTGSKFLSPNLDIVESKVIKANLNMHAGAQFKPNKNITFDFEVDGNAWIAPEDCFFVINTTLNSSTTNTERLAGQAYAYNTGCALFSKVSHYINNVLVDSSNQPLIHESYHYRTNFGNAYKSAYLDAMNLGDYASRLANMGANTVVKHELIWKPVCLSTFTSDLKLPAGKHRFVLQINPNWQTDIVENDGHQYVYNTAAGALNYNVTIDALQFEYKLYMGEQRPEHPIHIPLKGYHIDYKELYGSTEQILQFIIPANTHRLAFFFQGNAFNNQRKGFSKSDFTMERQTDRAAMGLNAGNTVTYTHAGGAAARLVTFNAAYTAGSIKVGDTLIIAGLAHTVETLRNNTTITISADGLTADVAATNNWSLWSSTPNHLQLASFYYKIGDRLFPDPPQQFDFNGRSTKMFKDTVNALLKNTDWESHDDWAKAPVYVTPFAHSNEKDLKDIRLNLQLRFASGTNLQQMRLWLVCEYHAVMSLEYTQHGLTNVYVE